MSVRYLIAPEWQDVNDLSCCRVTLRPSSEGSMPRAVMEASVGCARRAVAAPHLVSAACHRDPGIASLAVDCLRHLVGQLLSRAELSNFTYQVGPRFYAQPPRACIPVMCQSDSTSLHLASRSRIYVAAISCYTHA